MIRLTACCDTAHKLGEEHVRKQGPVGPDLEAWLALADGWFAKGTKRWTGTRWESEEWSATELRCIQAYTAAALGYESELVQPRTYLAPPEKRGLWDGGNRWTLMENAA